jgi:hypothetical protein
MGRVTSDTPARTAEGAGARGHDAETREMYPEICPRYPEIYIPRYISRDMYPEICIPRYISRDIHPEIYIPRYISRDVYPEIYIPRYISAHLVGETFSDFTPFF